VNRCLAHRAVPLLAALLLSLGVALPLPTAAHEGEDHGSPEPVAIAASGETLLAIGGVGSLFEAVLKYRPFVRGDAVAVTLYLVSAETNRPIADATVGATLSEGDRSVAVAFAPKLGGPVGAYSATVTAETAEPMSWLFEVAAGSDSDLIGITGFQTSRLPHSDSTVGKISSYGRWGVSPRHLAALAGGALLLVAAFAAGRLTARGRASA